MSILWFVLGLLLVVLGIIGAVLPILPGLPISYLGLLLFHFTGVIVFTDHFLVISLVAIVVAQILDYIIPIWTTKHFGGSKFGVWGCVLGMIAGLWFGVLGVILGPIVGAVLGELVAGKRTSTALKAGFGSFIGFLGGIVLKLIIGGYLIYGIVSGTLLL